MTLSPRFSFKGYDIRIAVANNMDIVKTIIALVGGISFATDFDWKTFLFTLVGAFGMFIVKILVDAAHYYFTEVENLPSPPPQ